MQRQYREVPCSVCDQPTPYRPPLYFYCSQECREEGTAPAPRDCSVCGVAVSPGRRRAFPTTVTCSTDCSVTHQANANRILNRDRQRKRRAQRKQLRAQSLQEN